MSHYCIEIGCDWMGGKSLFSGALATGRGVYHNREGHEQKCRIQDDNSDHVTWDNERHETKGDRTFILFFYVPVRAPKTLIKCQAPFVVLCFGVRGGIS